MNLSMLTIRPFFAALCFLTLIGCQSQTSATDRSDDTLSPAPVVVTPSSHDELIRLFALNNYDLDTLEEGVPKLIVESLPHDLDRITQIEERKRIFFLTLLPMVLMANEEIQAERALVETLLISFDRGEDISEGQRERLTEIQDKYRINGDPLNDQSVRRRLLKRIDILPPSLVLAQAANESAWGTSRFARLANNLFGEWTFTPGTGIVPASRPEGETYEVRSFPTLYDSVKSYMLNINTHRAYRSLREMRAHARLEDRPLRGVELAEGLTAYSIRREEYVAEIAAMIRHNRLTRFSHISLRGM